MHSKNLKMLVWVGLLVFCLSSAAWSKNPWMPKSSQKKAASEDTKNISLPKDLNPEEIDHIVAGLSDQQVRRLLIDALKVQALQETQATAAKSKSAGIAGFIDKVKNLTTLLHTRIEYLHSGGSAAPQQAGGIYDFLGRGERGTKTVSSVILSVAAVLAAALLIEWLFVFFTTAARGHLTSMKPDNWRAKIGVLSLRTLLDFAAIAIFILAALALFFGFLERTAGQRVLLSACLAAFVIVQVTFLVSRFFLAPRLSALRFLPFSDATALYLHRWVIALTTVGSFGSLACGIFRLAGASELEHFRSITLVSLIMAAMLIWMILQKRKAAAISFSRGLPESDLRYRAAQKWYIFAVLAVLLLLVFSTINRFLDFASGPGILTLVMVPLYFLMDWILRLILETAFGLVADNQTKPAPAEASAAEPEDDNVPEAASPAGSETPESPPARPAQLDLERLKGPLRAALRLALAMLLFFWILDIWHIDLPIGETVVRSVIKILVVVLFCYVAWGLINAAIMRRMSAEVPEMDSDDEKEEGSAGGSRIATLLLLLRKFLLVVIIVMASLIVLSALGVNIGPLIAGAGVFGLAIGFGAQTLVKDIISGVFFLMDDAFRVGDYLEVSGTKGTVEHISLRSLRLRNPRGQVYFIPFGDLKLVTNLSRDYVIMKLDFRVRYDADVEKIRKIIKKKVYLPIMDDPELGPKLLDPIKSQGVREMGDSAMVMRVKYKTKPGDQFAIRKEVYRLMQEAFREAGIEFAHRNVTVYMPPEVQNALAPADADTRQKIIQSGAAAALSAIEAEEQAKLAQQQSKKK
jgi:moderate conductance mechanosensitive channel